MGLVCGTLREVEIGSTGEGVRKSPFSALSEFVSDLWTTNQNFSKGRDDISSENVL